MRVVHHMYEDAEMVGLNVCRQHCELLDDGAGGGEPGEVEVCSREADQKSERIRVRMRETGGHGRSRGSEGGRV